MTTEQKFNELQNLIETILFTLEYANGSIYNPHLNDAIEEYRNEMKSIIDN